MKLFENKNIITVIVLVFLLIAAGLYFNQKQPINNSLKPNISNTNSGKSNIAIISTYGPSVEGSPFYETYITKAVKYISDPKNRVSNIIITGGYTVDRDRSQSQAVLEYVKKTFPDFLSLKIPILLDQCGVTTSQNIVNARSLIDSWNIKPEEITIFAETSRAKKIYFFANTTFLPFAKEDKQKVIDEIAPLINLPLGDQLKEYNNLETYYLAKYVVPSNLVKVIVQDAGLPKESSDVEYEKFFQDIEGYLDSSYGNIQIKERLDQWSKTAGFSVAQNLVSKGCNDYSQFISQ